MTTKKKKKNTIKMNRQNAVNFTIYSLFLSPLIDKIQSIFVPDIPKNMFDSRSRTNKLTEKKIIKKKLLLLL